MKKGKKRITAGCILVFLQALAVIGNLKEGVAIDLDFSNPMVVLYDLIFLLSYYFVGIVGVILIACGAYARFRKLQKKKRSDTKKRRKSVQAIEEDKKEEGSSESPQLSNDNVTIPVAEENSAPTTRQKPKKAVIILSIVCGLLVVALVLTMLYTVKSVTSQQGSEEILVDWLLENGELTENGTELVYKNKAFTLRTNNSKKIFVEYKIPNYDDYEIIVELPLCSKSEKVETTITVQTEDASSTLKYYHNAASFTRKSPVKHGSISSYPPVNSIHMDDYGESIYENGKYVFYVDEDKREEFEKLKNANIQIEEQRIIREDLAKNLSHEVLCRMLDWLNNTVCPMADCSLSDLGYCAYK